MNFENANHHCRGEIPQEIANHLHHVYGDALQIFFVGSRANGVANNESDYDFIIVRNLTIFHKIVSRVGECVMDVSIHSYNTLRRFMEMEKRQGSNGLANAIASGVMLKKKTDKCLEIFDLAKSFTNDSPPKFDLKLMKLHILGGVSDLRGEDDYLVKMVLVISLSFHLMNFSMKAGHVWAGEGRFCVSGIKKVDDIFLDKLNSSLNNYFINNEIDDFIELIETTLIKYTGDISEEISISYDV